jgi:hypothetical protein
MDAKHTHKEDLCRLRTFFRKEIYERLHPETRARNAEGHVSNHNPSSAESALEAARPFVGDASSKTGVSSRVIHEEIQIAKNLTPEAKEAVRRVDGNERL